MIAVMLLSMLFAYALGLRRGFVRGRKQYRDYVIKAAVWYASQAYYRRAMLNPLSLQETLNKIFGVDET